MPFAKGPAMRQIDAGKEPSCALRNLRSGATVVMADGNFLTSRMMQGTRSVTWAATSALALIVAFGCSGNSMNTDGARGGSSIGGQSGGSGGASARDAGGGAPAAQFPSEALSSFKTPDGALKIELRTLPAQPIHVGPDNEGELRFTDAATGEPVDGLKISVTTWMPVMGHKCASVPVGVKPQGGGAYLLTPLVASMPGACELKISVSTPMPDGGTSKAVSVTSPTFDVTQDE